MMVKHLTLLVLSAWAICPPVFSQSNNWQQLPGPEGGLVNDVAQSGNTWYAAAGNGVYRSTDLGDSWTRTDWTPGGLEVKSIYIRDNEILLLTHETDLEQFSLDEPIFHVYQSLDGGQTWNSELLNFDFFIDPGQIEIFRHRNKVYVYSGYYLLQRSPDGMTWTNLLGNNFQINNIFHNDSLFVGSTSFGGPQYSRNGGQSWSNLVSYPPNGSSSGTFTAGQGNTILYFEDYEISYRTLNFGQSWQSIGMPLNNAEPGSCVSLPGGKLAALISYPDTDEMMYVSDDNGLHWEKIGGSPREMALDVVYSDSTFGVATPRGFYKTYPGGNFLNPSNKGLNASSVRTILPVDDRIIAGASDGIWISEDKGNHWFSGFPQPLVSEIVNLQIHNNRISALANSFYYYSDDGGYTWTNPFETNISNYGPFNNDGTDMIVNDYGILVGAYDLFKSVDDGKTWTTTYPISRLSGLKEAGNYVFAMGFWSGVYRSTDQGATWQLVKSGTVGEGKTFYIQGKLFASTSAAFFRTTNLGSSWTTPTGIPTHYTLNYPMPITGMVANDTSIFAAVAYKGIYKSKDGGNSWAPFSTDMPDKRFTDMVLIDNVLYVACEKGGIYKYNLSPTSKTNDPTDASTLAGIWPNPATGSEINILLPEPIQEEASLRILDMNGRTIRSAHRPFNGQTAKMDIQGLPAGMYMIDIRTQTGAWQGQFQRITAP